MPIHLSIMWSWMRANLFVKDCMLNSYTVAAQVDWSLLSRPEDNVIHPRISAPPGERASSLIFSVVVLL